MPIEIEREENRVNPSKFVSRIFGALAILLSQIMCAFVSYTYCELKWASRYSGWSAPADKALWYIVPFAAAIGVCAALSWVFHKSTEEVAEPDEEEEDEDEDEEQKIEE